MFKIFSLLLFTILLGCTSMNKPEMMTGESPYTMETDTLKRLEKIPALFIKREKLWDRAQNSDFLLINEKRRMLGLNDIDGGDVILIPLNYTVLQPGEVLTPVLGKTQVDDIEDDGELNNSTSEEDTSDDITEDENEDTVDENEE